MDNRETSKRGAKLTLHLKMKTGEKAVKQERNKLLDDLADKSGLAIVLTNETAPDLSKSNNNSMCEMLYNSDEFAPHCAKFCGKAFDLAIEAGRTVGYKCYAGLSCLAVPMKKEEKQLVAIVGRAFTEVDDYRNATSRAIEGDWRQFSSNEFFENVLLANSKENLERVAAQVQKLNERLEVQSSKLKVQSQESSLAGNGQQLANNGHQPEGELNFKSRVSNPKSTHWRSLFGSLLDMSYRQACFMILQFVADRYAIENLAWLERRENHLDATFAKGNLKDREIQVNLPADDERLIDALREEISLELRERQTDKTFQKPQTIRLFPVAVGDEIKSALVIGDEIGDREKAIARFCSKIAADLEILRLREQLTRRGWLESAIRKFNQSLKSIDSEDFWSDLMNVSAELLKAERSSLLIYDEKTERFVGKAATGIKADFIKKETEHLGERVSKNVLNSGEAVAIEDINKIGLPAAPADWLYQSASFISYPIAIGERKIGVLNLTDRVDGETYSEFDLELLHAIMPQLAVLIDRASLKHKAGEFEQLSVTDVLTGLLNRRYLEERLTEEIKRSQRHKFPMSFMMIDVDDFKSYNDTFGHIEGDKALQIVGICLKEALRAIDVASRFGGEEFSVLLPQTNSAKAVAIAERVRERVEQTDFPNRRVTISIGVASISTSLDSENDLIVASATDLIAAADKALYEAKRRGKNNVQVYENLKK